MNMMKQQMTTTERKWYPAFFEGPLDSVRVSKRFAGLQGVFYVTDQQQPSYTLDEDSECGWSDDRSVAGDKLDIDWMLYLSSKTFPDELMQQLIAAPHPDASLARYEQSGLNIMGEYVELQWHIYNNPEGSFGSLNQVCAFQKARAQRHRPACPQDLRWSCDPNSNSRPYLTGKEMVIINEGVCDYIAECDGELSDFIAYLRKSSDHMKAEATNPVPHWVDQIDQNDLLDPHDFAPYACGGKAMEELLLYREESEPGYPTQESSTSFFEPSFLSVDVLDEEYDRKEQEKEALLIDIPPRCREIVQVCDVHAVPTNNIWVLIDSCFEDPNRRIVPECGSLPVPGMLTRTSYPPEFHITPGFLQVPFERLVPRCEHGHLHPPALEFCPECFPSGQHRDCLECESHPVLRKKKGCDFALAEFQELENRKQQHDQDQFAAAYQATRVNKYLQQFEIQTASQCLVYHW
ncbi:hypothetical protein N0V94_004956 [Neodidymelliopsis sp. IMI 364377]|nr:hypothetical protein N0V94_004956 [Neodidymelliopsis sp. IMI 364377]